MVLHVALQEWRSTGPDDPATPTLRGAALDGAPERALAARLRDSGVLEVLELRDGLHLQAFAHVGRVQVGSLTVTIEPKVGAYQLLELLRYAHDLRHVALFDTTAFATKGALLQDLLVMQLVAEVTSVTSRGLARAYVGRIDALPTPRGRIDMSALAANFPLADARLTCRHYLRSGDHLINRVLLAGLRLGGAIAQDASLRRSTKRLAARLATDVGHVRLTADALERARRRLDRLTAAYEPALRLIELLFACRAISMDGEETTPLRGFLFDMNRFFQALMGRFLKDQLADYEVAEEEALRHMMRYVPGLNPRGKRSPTPRPDFVVRKGKTVCALADAKYRDLWHHDLPREMLYQLALYALSLQGSGTAAILYPTVSSAATEAQVEISEPTTGRTLGFVALRPVIVGELIDAIHGRRDARGLAYKYAFGRA